jgi:hypothetical protein
MLSSKAWLIRGIGNLLGELKLENGRLSFTTLGYGQLLSFQCVV